MQIYCYLRLGATFILNLTCLQLVLYLISISIAIFVFNTCKWPISRGQNLSFCNRKGEDVKMNKKIAYMYKHRYLRNTFYFSIIETGDSFPIIEYNFVIECYSGTYLWQCYLVRHVKTFLNWFHVIRVRNN